MSPHVKDIELVNNSLSSDDIINIKVVDYFHTFGAFIDRSKNEKLNIRKHDMREFAQDIDNYDHYLIHPDANDKNDIPEVFT
jgi:hypothetical protein